MAGTAGPVGSLSMSMRATDERKTSDFPISPYHQIYFISIISLLYILIHKLS